MSAPIVHLFAFDATSAEGLQVLEGLQQAGAESLHAYGEPDSGQAWVVGMLGRESDARFVGLALDEDALLHVMRSMSAQCARDELGVVEWSTAMGADIEARVYEALELQRRAPDAAGVRH